MSSAFAPSVPLFEVPASSAVQAPVTAAAAISSAVITISHFPCFTKSSTLAVSTSASAALSLLLSSTTLTFECCHLSCYCDYFVLDGSSLSVQHEQATLGIPKPKLGAQDLRIQLGSNVVQQWQTYRSS
ncbi:hypothetical protein HPP92_025576 [Vanilla planifolia]|uniref:Uncharacterized protein n=1 Tax=Vanilla planifolia TaxID=51239 RepID=A0A835PJU6_VANPL|nr:hypothetical protein HPP92_025576 [Vanilla planifolia]